ncbi:phosphoribosyl transferase domain [Lecanosticta acicola]|uniref:Phosphoribosyl transferase domain n=1 Tax=Lecanosticta acicola TaxID=111012 RepID=A0AAI9EE38_9PEZI|nr:phosphoribosyl transferase domain [Lecanosticta acicola]
MATLNFLKSSLEAVAEDVQKLALSDEQYSLGLDIVLQGTHSDTYRQFIVPQLSRLFARLSISQTSISILEIGPGPKTVLGLLPHHLRRRVKRYVAFEPNAVFAANLAEFLAPKQEKDKPLPRLHTPADIRAGKFTIHQDAPGSEEEKFDLILFCHSMSGMRPKRAFVERSLNFLAKAGMVVVFHRSGSLEFDGLVCHATASFPTGVVRVPNEDEKLDQFAPFIAGFMPCESLVDDVLDEWQRVCRENGRISIGHADQIEFSSPEVMVAFTHGATSLPELLAKVPTVVNGKPIKSPEARSCSPATIVRPEGIQHVRECVLWALHHGHSLTVLSGSHGGHCIVDHTVCVDMSAFNEMQIVPRSGGVGHAESAGQSLVVAQTGCDTGDIIRGTMVEGLTVPLGARPSVGAGLWLQGGIGHLSRQHGLACDAIVGAILVSVDSGGVFVVGHVPEAHQPSGATRPANEDDILWALRGAGTNFGIVVSVTFKAFPASKFLTGSWKIPLNGNLELQSRIEELNAYAIDLPPSSSLDFYLYSEADQLNLGAILYEARESADRTSDSTTSAALRLCSTLGVEQTSQVVDAVDLFDTEMYVSGMHGGHGGGKTSSFKRCVFLRSIDATKVLLALTGAMDSRPSPLCYLHLLHAGKAVTEIEDDATAFGCRDWEFACVVTGVWKRSEDGTAASRSATAWVYSTVKELLIYCQGVYGADLGPDPRDASLAAYAFGPNRPRLARLKRKLDPHNVLAHACPLPQIPKAPKVIILVTGEICAGKDFCADVWVEFLSHHHRLTARAVSISDATKREYASLTGADLNRLLHERAYKEEHRTALTTFFRQQVRDRPWLPEDHFLQLVHGASDTDVLFVTGMRDDAPVATFSHLVPHSKVIELRVRGSKETREHHARPNSCPVNSNDKQSDWQPDLIFDNYTAGEEQANLFASSHLLPLIHRDFHRLGDMVRSVPDFPRKGVEFHHVLNIAQQAQGLSLCAKLMESHFPGDWSKIGTLVCCESGGFVFGAAVATRMGLPLALIREAGKLPPPTVSAAKRPSFISSLAIEPVETKRFEMAADAIPTHKPVVVIDDVLSTGTTLCAVLQLLVEVGVSVENTSVMVVVEFPVHRGRQFLREQGFGKVRIQSLLVFGCT